VLTDSELRKRGLKWVGAFSWRWTGEQMSPLLDEVHRGANDRTPRP
jgi:hypothetical protein